MEIREGTIEQCAIAFSLVSDFMKEQNRSKKPVDDPEYLRSYLSAKKQIIMLVALVESEVVGARVGYELTENPSISYAWLGGVSDQYRRRGIFSALHNIYCETAKNLGFEAIAATTWRMQEPIIHTYRKLGYHLVKVRSKDQLGSEHDRIDVQLDLLQASSKEEIERSWK